jgi:hypothetical protein
MVLTLWVSRTSSTSRDQAILVDQTTGASLSSDAVLLKIDRFGRFRYHAEQSREQCPVRPVQVRAARLPPLQDGELVAQDQDLCGLPRLLTLG